MCVVVPYVGTWIEIQFGTMTGEQMTGRSLRGNVDRNSNIGEQPILNKVVPYVGTWIEIHHITRRICTRFRRSLRGNVDRNLHIHQVFQH